MKKFILLIVVFALMGCYHAVCKDRVFEADALAKRSGFSDQRFVIYPCEFLGYTHHAQMQVLVDGQWRYFNQVPVPMIDDWYYTSWAPECPFAGTQFVFTRKEFRKFLEVFDRDVIKAQPKR